MMNDLGSADIRVGFILGGFFYSCFVQERGLKPREHTPTHPHTHQPFLESPPRSSGSTAGESANGLGRKKGGEEERPREGRGARRGNLGVI